MWAVKIDGFTRAEFAHHCDAAEFAESLPGNESEHVTIVPTMPDATTELRIRLAPLKRLRAEQIRNARRNRKATKWGAM